jgi:hypothetical protein
VPLGAAEHAHGFRSIAEAICLRDHIVRQLETGSLIRAAVNGARCHGPDSGQGSYGCDRSARTPESLAGELVAVLVTEPRQAGAARPRPGAVHCAVPKSNSMLPAND